MELDNKCQEAIKEAIGLLLSDAYFDRYYLLLAQHGNLATKEVWELLEADLFKLTGRNRFASYEIFMRQRWQYVKKMQPKA
jgi:hypothetical protein